MSPASNVIVWVVMPLLTKILSPATADAGKFTCTFNVVAPPNSAALIKPSLLASSTMLTVGLVVTTFAKSLVPAPTLPATSVICALTVSVAPSAGVG